MDINKEIGKRIKKQRENLKISQEELAHLINKQTITIKRIENGEYKRIINKKRGIKSLAFCLVFLPAVNLCVLISRCVLGLHFRQVMFLIVFLQHEEY